MGTESIGSEDGVERGAYSGVPIVSVIVPVLNDAARIGRCVEALLAQDHPRERLEIIVVDNGSTDGTREVISRYPVTLLLEDSARTPYIARNRGLERASGEVLAFTDADCTPRPDWITQALRALEESEADLVGGKVAFTFSDRRDAGECFDSITNLEMERNIRERGVAKTGNLIVRRKVVEGIGPFPDHQRSGGDVWWTGKASRAGFRIVYAPDVVVEKPARPLGALLRKQFRVGRGQIGAWRAEGVGSGALATRLARGFLPPSPGSVRQAIRQRGTPDMEQNLGRIVVAGWLARSATNLGRLDALLRRRQNGRRTPQEPV